MTPKDWYFAIPLVLFCILARAELCFECKNLAKSLNDSIFETMHKSFTGGDAEYEKKKLISYEKSETRLLEIMESISDAASTARKKILGKMEEVIEDWWNEEFVKNPKDFSYDILEQKLCFSHYCCPKGKYGKGCNTCEKCNPHGGVCSGDGTREGTGSCMCKPGYFGTECNECQEFGFFNAGEDADKYKTCTMCNETCRKCTGKKDQECEECMPGYRFSDEKICMDIDECSEETHCEEDGVFCENKLGSYSCTSCHNACSKCTGPKSDQCQACTTGYEMKDTTCSDIDECQVHGDLCSAENEQCINTPGSYKCSCKEGFRKNNEGACVPKEENKKDEL